MPTRAPIVLTLLATLPLALPTLRAEGEWEITPESEQALERGLEWLARNQGARGNWDSNDLGLVALGTLAFLSAGHFPGRGKHGARVERSLDYILDRAKPSGLLNEADQRRDMYNHGLATFVLGQAYGMTSDPRIGTTLDRALKLISVTQCEDGGWDYVARRQARGHDLSLAVMQAKALRSAMDSGLEVPPEVIALAIRSVREHYKPARGSRNDSEAIQRSRPGQFTYDGNRTTLAMAAAGVVCLQEFGQYEDWRISKNIDVIRRDVLKLPSRPHRGKVIFDAYTLYYVAQALYQAGGPAWRECYPRLRDGLVRSQAIAPDTTRTHGKWQDGTRVHGKPGELFGTAVACFVLAIPNRYLPILQEGEIEGLQGRFGSR